MDSPHARRSGLLPPQEPPAGPLRVVFLGTVRPHKGLRELLQAWSICERGDAELHVVGTPAESRHLKDLAIPTDGSVIFQGPVPFSEVPDCLGRASVVVIPQLVDPGSVGQLPTKLIEGMAMGRAILSTDIADIPHWLRGCGVVVPPGDPYALADALGQLLADPSERERLGTEARRRFELTASREAVQPRLIALFEAILAGRPLPLPVRPSQILGPEAI